jgi:hypothetical protein
MQGSGGSRVKKGGSGGKFTWGSVLDTDEGLASLDKNDPNYDSDGDGAIAFHTQKSVQIKIYKQAVSGCLDATDRAGAASVSDCIFISRGAQLMVPYLWQPMLQCILF